MDKLQINKLLVQMSYVDQRKIDDYTIEMWFRIIGHEDYEMASQAIPRCYAESNEYLTPHRVLVMIKKIREEQATTRIHQERQEIEATWQKSLHPVCREHGKLILQCRECCKKITDHDNSRTNRDALHAWATQHIYAPATEWKDEPINV